MEGIDALCYQGHRPGRSKHKKKPVGSPESQSKISEGVGDPRAGASGAMRAPTTRRRKTSRGCACLSLTARLSTLGCWSGGFCRRSTLQPPWGVAQATPQSNPRRPRRHLVAARCHRVTQLRGGRGPCRWNCKTSNPVVRPGSGGVRRPTVSASAPRFWAAGRRYRQPEPPGPRLRPCRPSTMPGRAWSSLVFAGLVGFRVRGDIFPGCPALSTSWPRRLRPCSSDD